MKKVIIFFATLMVILLIMFTEYRVIMVNITPYHGEGNTLYLEIFGNVDVYDCE